MKATRITQENQIGRRARMLPATLSIAAGLGGIALEGFAIRHSGLGGSAFSPVDLLPPHLGSSALMAIAFGIRNKPRVSFMAFVFCFCLVLPVLGLLGMLLGVWPALRRFATSARTGYAELVPERRHARGPLFQARFDLGGFRARLLQSRIPAARRLSMLMALGRRSTPAGNRLLRNLLRDTNDEIRLAAYAILDRREKEMQASLAAAESEAKRAAGDSDRAAAWHRLAALHWEAAYQDLAEGELSRRHLEKALQAIETALAARPEDASFRLLQGRILARMGSLAAAREAYARLDRAGLPARRVRPYRAELAFLARDFGSVRMHLAALSPQEVGPALNKVMQFWSGKAA